MRYHSLQPGQLVSFTFEASFPRQVPLPAITVCGQASRQPERRGHRFPSHCPSVGWRTSNDVIVAEQTFQRNDPGPRRGGVGPEAVPVACPIDGSTWVFTDVRNRRARHRPASLLIGVPGPDACDETGGCGLARGSSRRRPADCRPVECERRGQLPGLGYPKSGRGGESRRSPGWGTVVASRPSRPGHSGGSGPVPRGCARYALLVIAAPASM